MDNQEKDLNQSENQTINEENSNPNSEQQETPILEEVNNSQGLDTQPEEVELKIENQTTEIVEEAVVTPAEAEPVVNSASVEPTKKKHTGRMIAILVAIAIVLIGSITAFANRGKLTNTLAMMTKSSSEYYAYIEENNVDKYIDAFTNLYSKSLDQYKKGIASDTNITFNISPEFAMMMGLAQIKPVSAQFESTTKDGTGNVNGAVSYDSKTLATLEMLFDMNQGNYFFKIPELSSAYLSSSLSVDESELTDIQVNKLINNVLAFSRGELLPAETLNKLLKKYSSDVYNNIKTVEVEKNVEVTASDIVGKYNKITASISQKDAYDIVMAILEDAKTDNDIMKLLVETESLTEEEYKEAIENAISSIKEEEADLSTEAFLKMIVYVDGNGNIIGRELMVLDEFETSLGYVSAMKDSNLGFHVWLNDKDQFVFEISGQGKYSNGSFTGDAVIGTTTYDDFYGETVSSTFNLAFENVKYKDNKLDGTFTLSSDLLMGMEFVAEFKSAEKQQDTTIKMMAGGIETMALQITSKEIAFKEFQMPSSSEQIYNMATDMESYLMNSDMNGFLTNIQNVLGEDFGLLLDSILSGM